MGEWRNAALQTAFWTYANSLRCEAKLCDLVLYVPGRKGAMVGYPAHKLLLISASKYFKLLFEREELRNYCHFPHLSEDGLFTVLDIVYGREVADNVNLDDALMAARFLQVDCAVEELEAKRVALEAKAKASPKPKKQQSGIKRKALSPGNVMDRAPSRDTYIHSNESSSQGANPGDSAEMRIFKNVRNQVDEESVSQTFQDSTGSPISHEENSSMGATDGAAAVFGGNYDSEERIKVKTEPNMDMATEDDMGYSQGDMTDHGFGQIQMDNAGGQADQGLGMYGSFGADDTATFGDHNMFEGANFAVGMDNVDKKRQCDICGKVFATAKHLEDHRATHTDFGEIRYARDDVRPFVCDICLQSFKKKHHMQRHRLTNHSDLRPFDCPVCGKTFKRVDHLQLHHRVAHTADMGKTN